MSQSQQALRVDPEVDRQVFGYWFAPGEAISPFPPGRPTGAVLPRIGANLDDPEVLCLDLSGLLHDHEWRFVPVPEAVGTWPVVFALTHADSLTCEEMNAWYGLDAALRTPPDVSAVQLRLTPGAEFEMAIPPGDDLSDEERAALHASLERPWMTRMPDAEWTLSSICASIALGLRIEISDQARRQLEEADEWWSRNRDDPDRTPAREECGRDCLAEGRYTAGVSSQSQQALKVDPELDRQVFGYWFGPGEAVPPFPLGRPTGAVLPEVGASFDGPEVLCLDLVPVQNYWIVLSELGRYTYRHTSGLVYDDEWRFVPVPEVVGAWPVVFVVTYANSLSYDEIKACYGPDAALRARPDAPAVQLRLTRQS